MSDLKNVTSQTYQLNAVIAQRQQASIKSEQTLLTASVDASQDYFMESCIDGYNRSANPLNREGKTLKERSTKELKTQQADQKTQKVSEVAAIRALAKEFSRHNPELDMRKLLQLLDDLKDDDSPEDILDKIRETGFEDPTLMDQVLEFLSKATSGTLAKTVQIAREQLNKEFAREIRAGENISEDARNYSEMGMGTPTDLRELYRDITGNPRETTTLFEQLTERYSPEEIQVAIEFLLHAMGADMKSEGPSIERAQLHRLMTEVRSLQAILGVHKFFEGRTGLMAKMFKLLDIDKPIAKQPDLLARIFVKFIGNRYPTSEKLLRLATTLDVEDDIEAQIVLFSQYRDAVRQTSLRLYQSQQHRDDVYMAILDGLEELEKIIDEEANDEDDNDDDIEDNGINIKQAETA